MKSTTLLANSKLLIAVGVATIPASANQMPTI